MIANCSWCGTDEFAELDRKSGVALCVGPGHPTERMWEPKSEIVTEVKTLADGIAAWLGLYDDLPTCLREGEWAETGVVEHRYGTEHPSQYRWMVDRWGHVCQGKRRYSVTTFIGTTLGALSRATNVTYREGKGTGFYDYNPTIGFWTIKPVPPDTVVTSWACAAVELGHQPGCWPLLGYCAGKTPTGAASAAPANLGP